MPANRFGIDLAEVYRTGAAVKGARTKNRMASLQLGELEREIEQRPEKERLTLERKNLLTGLRQKSVTGDIDASQQLLALDPEGGPAFIQAVDKMDERQREQAKANIDEMGRLSSYVLQGKDPAEQARRYLLMRGNVSEQVAKGMPEQYDPQFMELSMAKVMSMDQILEAPTVRAIGGEDVVYRGGREVERAERPVKDSAGKTGAGALKSADESLMYKQAVELLGGIFNEKGEITKLDPQARNRAQAIAAEAANIFVEAGNITRSEAVKRAAKSFGLNVQDVPPANPTDPNSIRDYLLSP